MAEASSNQDPIAWTISFGKNKAAKRKVSRKEAQALEGGNRVEATSVPEGDQTARNETVVSAGIVVNADDFLDEGALIPRNLQTTRDQILLRNYFDNIRFICMSRPQYKRTCGISSLTSVWNFLYSRIGHGDLAPVSQEEVMSILGFQPPFDTIRWGSFTGNITLLRWFHALNLHFGVQGKAYFFWKPHGHGRTIGLTNETAEAQVKDALRNPNMGIIYHCLNHYMVPIGYQEQPVAQTDIYSPHLAQGQFETHLIIGEVSRGVHPSIHVRKFSDVATDLNAQSPQYFNIRHPERGVQTRISKRKSQTPPSLPESPMDAAQAPRNPSRRGGNLHCFLLFRKDVVEDNIEQFVEEEEEEEEEDDIDAQML